MADRMFIVQVCLPQSYYIIVFVTMCQQFSTYRNQSDLRLGSMLMIETLEPVYCVKDQKSKKYIFLLSVQMECKEPSQFPLLRAFPVSNEFIYKRMYKIYMFDDIVVSIYSSIQRDNNNKTHPPTSICSGFRSVSFKSGSRNGCIKYTCSMIQSCLFIHQKSNNNKTHPPTSMCSVF